MWRSISRSTSTTTSSWPAASAGRRATASCIPRSKGTFTPPPWGTLPPARPPRRGSLPGIWRSPSRRSPPTGRGRPTTNSSTRPFPRKSMTSCSLTRRASPPAISSTSPPRSARPCNGCMTTAVPSGAVSWTSARKRKTNWPLWIPTTPGTPTSCVRSTKPSPSSVTPSCSGLPAMPTWPKRWPPKQRIPSASRSWPSSRKHAGAFPPIPPVPSTKRSSASGSSSSSPVLSSARARPSPTGAWTSISGPCTRPTSTGAPSRPTGPWNCWNACGRAWPSSWRCTSCPRGTPSPRAMPTGKP